MELGAQVCHVTPRLLPTRIASPHVVAARIFAARTVSPYACAPRTRAQGAQARRTRIAVAMRASHTRIASTLRAASTRIFGARARTLACADVHTRVLTWALGAAHRWTRTRSGRPTPPSSRSKAAVWRRAGAVWRQEHAAVLQPFWEGPQLFLAAFPSDQGAVARRAGAKGALFGSARPAVFVCWSLPRGRNAASGLPSLRRVCGPTAKQSSRFKKCFRVFEMCFRVCVATWAV